MCMATKGLSHQMFFLEEKEANSRINLQPFLPIKRVAFLSRFIHHDVAGKQQHQHHALMLDSSMGDLSHTWWMLIIHQIHQQRKASMYKSLLQLIHFEHQNLTPILVHMHHQINNHDSLPTTIRRIKYWARYFGKEKWSKEAFAKSSGVSSHSG